MFRARAILRLAGGSLALILLTMTLGGCVYVEHDTHHRHFRHHHHRHHHHHHNRC